MMTPLAPAAWAFWTLVPKVHVPRWMSAIRPAVKPLKSDAVHPLDELDVGVGEGLRPAHFRAGDPPQVGHAPRPVRPQSLAEPAP
jgi:hypothetical protein